MSASVLAFEDRPDLIEAFAPNAGAPTGMLSADPPINIREVKMRASSRRGPGPSHVLLTPDRAGNVVGVDPHKRTLTATVVDPRGGLSPQIPVLNWPALAGDGSRSVDG